jgi:hypothetical protein
MQATTIWNVIPTNIGLKKWVPSTNIKEKTRQTKG